MADETRLKDEEAAEPSKGSLAVDGAGMALALGGAMMMFGSLAPESLFVLGTLQAAHRSGPLTFVFGALTLCWGLTVVRGRMLGRKDRRGAGLLIAASLLVLLATVAYAIWGMVTTAHQDLLLTALRPQMSRLAHLWRLSRPQTVEHIRMLVVSHQAHMTFLRGFWLVLAGSLVGLGGAVVAIRRRRRRARVERSTRTSTTEARPKVEYDESLARWF